MQRVVLLQLKQKRTDMSTSDLAKLENNKKLKKDYLNKTPWWRTTLLIAPVCFLFIGLAGLLYLHKVDMLVSYYSIPFILVFAIATIWLKSVKRHIVNTKLAVQGSYLVCAAKAVETDSQYAYVVFVTSAQRHYEHHVSKLASALSKEDIASIKMQAGHKSAVLYNEGEETPYYARAFKLKDIEKQCNNWNEEKTIPLLFIDEKRVFIVNKKYFLK